ncbi:MAG TPA: hypothetical protein VGO06_23365 [Bosea sp. (in: a-proteobacteria)]|uniref:hypothetical protein n=1 Tax=Bosea sp. (in: a-proteobacteria) TaxID=1871050 RepID=UPI002E15B5C0|nr:hypothetical protein [Bosea sp. (in: a-proteobacteria)]
MSADRNRLTALIALAAASLTSAAPAQANFLETLFGIAPRQVVAPVPEREPLHMTVRPRAQRDGKPGIAAKDTPPTPRVAPMEYASDPFWYLKDPTLKKGDIIVLDGRVVVFNGGERSYSSFLSLKDSRLLSERSKKQLKHMVSTPLDTHTIWEPAEIMKSNGAMTTVEVSESAR